MKTLLSLLTAGLGICVHVANAQNIDSANTIGRVIVTPGGTPAGQFVAPWLDVPPTMQYVDGLPVVRESPHPPLPGSPFVAPLPGEIPGSLAFPTLAFVASLNGSNAVPFNPNYAWQGAAQFTLSNSTLVFGIMFSTDTAALDQARLIGLSGTPLLSLGEPQRVIHEPCNGIDPCSPGATIWSGQLILTEQQRSKFLAGGITLGLLPSRAFGDPNPIGEILGQIVAVGPDSDRDGVPDDRDACPDTPAGAVVNAHGCSIAQLSPCDANWRNHGAYVRCVIRSAVQFQRQHLITSAERRAVVRAAIHSDCGKHCSQ